MASSAGSTQLFNGARKTTKQKKRTCHYCTGDHFPIKGSASMITVLVTKPENLESWWSVDENLSAKKALPYVEGHWKAFLCLGRYTACQVLWSPHMLCRSDMGIIIISNRPSIFEVSQFLLSNSQTHPSLTIILWVKSCHLILLSLLHCEGRSHRIKVSIYLTTFLQVTWMLTDLNHSKMDGACYNHR